MPTIALRLLGAFALTSDGAPLEGFAQPRLQALVAYLALHRRTPVLRARLAAALWPETNDEQALKNLRTLLARLRAALPEADALLAADALTLQWRPGAPGTLDVAAFEDALARAAAAQDARAARDALAAAADLYAGDLLAGRQDEWLLPERDRLRAAWLGALEQLAAACERLGDARDALAAAQRLTRADPLHEGAYAAAMRAQLALGDRAGALRTYHACAALLRDELGVDPGAATQAVYERVLLADERPVTSEQSTVRSEQSTVVGDRPRVHQPRISSLQSPPLIGRAAELAWLQARWNEAASGATQVALVAGEAGIGKTRLAEELLAWVERQEAAADIAVARCYAGAAVAYAPVVEWLRSPAAEARLRAADPAWRSEAARLLPELLAAEPALEKPEPLAEAWQRHRFFRGLVEVFVGRSVASPYPLLLLLEDVQWADAETLEWLPFFANSAAEAGAPVLLLLTLRAEEAGDDDPLAILRRTLQRAGRLREITLRPLDTQETAALAAALATDPATTTALSTERHATDRAAQEAAAQLFRDTEGNPLFIVETVRAGQQGGAPAPVADDAALGLPPKVLATLRYRLGRLSADARALAEHAAVLGRAFRYDALAAMLGDDQNEEALVRGLDELWRTRIVREQGADAYDFSHDKLRAVAYAGLSRARRRLLHRRAASALERLHAADLTPVSAGIAAHYEQAGDPAAAIPHYRRAAEAAQAVYATSEAIRLYRHLLGNELAPLLSPADKCDLLLALSEMFEQTNQGGAAEEAARAAITDAAALGDPLRLAWAHFYLGRALFIQNRFDASLSVLAQARAEFERSGERRGLLRVLGVTGDNYFQKADIRQARAFAEVQLALAKELGDLRGVVDALNAVSISSDSAAASVEALPIAEAVGYKPGQLWALYLIAADQPYRPDALPWALRAAALAVEIGDSYHYTSFVKDVAYTLLECGDQARALATLLRLGQEQVTEGNLFEACLTLMLAGAALLHMRRLDEAEAVARAIVQAFQQFNTTAYLTSMQALVADTLLEQGRFTEAAPIIEEALAVVRSRPPTVLTSFDPVRRLRIASVRTRLGQGLLDAEDAVAELETLLPGAGGRETAEIVYRRWQISGSDEHRLAATAALRDTYAARGYVWDRVRYHELTGEWLPAPALPDVSALIPAAPDLDILLTGVKALLPQLTSPA